MTDQIPPEIDRLLDSHGAGIPHMSFEGGYIINVYPEYVDFKRTFWGIDWGIPKKVVNIWNRETGEHWRRVIDD